MGAQMSKCLPCVAQGEKLIKINGFTDSRCPLVLAFVIFLESRGHPLLKKRGL